MSFNMHVCIWLKYRTALGSPVFTNEIFMLVNRTNKHVRNPGQIDISCESVKIIP